MTHSSSLPDSAQRSFDFVLVGAGLQNALIALSVLARRPEASLALIEASPQIGGNHTWSFHAGDVPQRAQAFVEPLVAWRWRGYEVAFPGLDRQIEDPYSAISAERLRQVVSERLRAAPNAVLLTGTAAVEVRGREVTLAGGARIRGKLVVDARGPERLRIPAAAGFQKFLGLELELEAPSPRSVPLLMDARVAQTDGFRFFYLLPLDERRVLIEDTYFSDSSELDRDTLRREIRAYAATHGFVIRRTLREESGVLPLPTRGLSAPSSDSPILGGYAGGWFHPATGYSLPVALKLALYVAEQPVEAPFGEAWHTLTRQHAEQFRFAAFLNRLLFTGFSPEDRWNALARFYKMPAATIRRFYALDTTSADRLRLLCGRPPSRLSLKTLVNRGAFA